MIIRSVTLFFLWASVAAAQTQSPTGTTADDWQRDCRAYVEAMSGEGEADDLALVYCLGLSLGIIDGLRTGSQVGALSMASRLTVAFELESDEVFRYFQSSTARRLLQICTPADVRLGDQIRVIYDYIEEHPDDRSQPIAAIFFQALQAEYPCEE